MPDSFELFLPDSFEPFLPDSFEPFLPDSFEFCTFAVYKCTSLIIERVIGFCGRLRVLNNINLLIPSFCFSSYINGGGGGNGEGDVTHVKLRGYRDEAARAEIKRQEPEGTLARWHVAGAVMLT